MPHARPNTREKTPKRVLALPDLEHAKSAVLSLTLPRGQRTYDYAIRGSSRGTARSHVSRSTARSSSGTGYALSSGGTLRPRSTSAGGRSLLIVDDDAEVRRLLKRLLADVVQEIVECDNGNDAVAAVTAANPDVVLMDIGLPGMDGINATRCIRSAWPSATVVIVTNYDGRSMRAAATAAGAAAYVLKDNRGQNAAANLVRRLTKAVHRPPPSGRGVDRSIGSAVDAECRTVPPATLL